MIQYGFDFNKLVMLPFWTPAFAGVTALETFYETIKFGVPKVKECFAHFL